MFLGRSTPPAWRAAWTGVLCICAMLGAQPGHAQVHMQDALLGRQAETRVQAGVDFWQQPYRDVSPWASASVGYDPMNHLSLRLRAQTHQEMGGRLDELSATYDVSPAFGLRAGVLDFYLAWCKDYESSNPWIQDPNAFCADLTRKRTVGSAPGLQAYGNGTRGDYQVQAVAGIYKPQLLDYAPQTYSDARQQLSVAANALNVFTGVEYHLAWLRTDTARQEEDTWYAALQFPLSLRWTVSANLHQSPARSDGLGAELQYTPGGTDRWVLGVSGSEAVSLAWRHDWPGGGFSALQWSHTKGQEPDARVDNALGLRVGYRF